MCVNHKETTMTISVIIPSYKPGEYINDCLKSIKEQSLSESEYEVIIILNGCCEPYLEMLTSVKKSLFHNSDNVHIIQTDIPGVSNARNLGIEAAKGEYITFIDDDDVISPTYLEGILSVSSPNCIGCSNSYAFKDSLRSCNDNFITIAYKTCKHIDFSAYNYRSFLSPPWCKLIHRDIIGRVRFSKKLKKGEDGLFCFALVPQIKNMKLATEDVIYYQRLRSGSAMRKKNSLINEFLEAFRQEKILLSIWIKKPFSYNCIFFMTRIIGIIKNFFVYIR